MKKMIMTALVMLGLALIQQTATAGIFRINVYGAPRPVCYSPHYVYAAPVCPAPVVYSTPAYYAPAPAVVLRSPVIVASLPAVRIHLGHLHIWF